LVRECVCVGEREKGKERGMWVTVFVWVNVCVRERETEREQKREKERFYVSTHRITLTHIRGTLNTEARANIFCTRTHSTRVHPPMCICGTLESKVR